jgi:hypothetical protein
MQLSNPDSTNVAYLKSIQQLMQLKLIIFTEQTLITRTELANSIAKYKQLYDNIMKGII